jgi:CheY-like chemotaxis protein
LLPATTAEVQAVHAEEPVTPGRGRVLVMDDDEMVRSVCGQMLAHLGYEVEHASDGAEALRVYARAMEAGRRFDAVILDLTVPGGMGGRDAIARLREIDPQVNGIVSSGYSNDPIMSEHRKHGFKGVMVKPYEVRELARVLREVLGARLA